MKYLFQIIFPLFLFLSGCMVGPNYHRPEIPMPQEFVESKGEPVAVADDDFYQWWKLFDDQFLNDIIQEAIDANFDMRIAVEKIFQARAQFRIRSADLWPEFNFNAVATRTRNSQNFFDSAAGTSTVQIMENFFFVGFDAVWELDFFGKFRRAKRAAYDLWEASIEDAQNVMLSIIAEVARNYVSVRAFQRRIDLDLQKVRLDKEELALRKALFEAGLNSEVEVENAKANLERNKALVPNLETSLKQGIYGLAFLLGKQPEYFVYEFPNMGMIPSGRDRVPVGLPSELLRRRPDIRRAERQLAAATEQIGVAVADYFPRVSLTGTTVAGGQLVGSTWGFQSRHLNNLFSSGSQTWSVGPSILWNIIDFGRIRGNVAYQTSLQRQALIIYEETVVSSLRDVEGALVAYFEEQKRLDSLTKQITADQRSLQFALDLFQAGLASEIDVIAARQKVLDSEIQQVDSEEALTTNLIALYKALGGNWECSYTP